MIAVLDRRRRDRLQIGTSPRFGHRNGADEFTRNHARQDTVFLLLGAVVDQIGDHD